MVPDWTAACLASDLPPGVVLRSDCAGVELALWRSASGRVSAWRDRCQHRGMRLSHGFVRGETLSCIYHGWVYGSDGGCRRIPAHPGLGPPAAIHADIFRAAEAGGLIWIAGEPAASPPADLGLLHPVRSLLFACGAEHLLQGLPTTFHSVGQGVWQGTAPLPQPVMVTIALQPLPDQTTMVHSVADSACPDQRVWLSRWLEGLRRETEAQVGQAEAAA